MQPYSTLEVRRFEDHDVYDNDGAYKEAVDHPTSLYPEHIPFENDASGVYDPQAIHHGNELSPSAVSEGATKTSKICGLSRRRFYLVLAIGVLVIIGAIVGGLAGGLLSRQHNSTPHPNVNILNISKLASSNSTDSNGNIHRTVFFQDTNNAIIARRWDSQNRTWETSNLTEMMRESRTPLNPLPGTPLASASRNWNAVDEVHLWFLAPDSYISSLYLASPDTKSNNDWKYDSLNDSQIRTRSGSQLAAMWQRCSAENCTGSWLVAYQTPDGDINVANASRWDSPTRAVEAKNVAANSSLGLSPKLHDDSGVDLAMLVSEAVGSGSTSDMQRAIYEGGWGLSECSLLFFTLGSNLQSHPIHRPVCKRYLVCRGAYILTSWLTRVGAKQTSSGSGNYRCRRPGCSSRSR